MRQLLLELLPAPSPCFDNFVVGGNRETLAALRQWLAGAQPTCFLLWGESGCGRSHLLNASGAACFDAAPDRDLLRLPDEFAPATVIAVDNADALAADGQIALFNAFNRLRAVGGRLLVSAGAPPQQLALREDLRTRLGSGLIYRLQALSDDEKSQALRERAGQRGLRLADEVLDYLFRHARRDMGSLTALIDALDRFTLEHRRPVTLPLLRQLLANAPTEVQNHESRAV